MASFEVRVLRGDSWDQVTEIQEEISGIEMLDYIDVYAGSGDTNGLGKPSK